MHNWKWEKTNSIIYDGNEQYEKGIHLRKHVQNMYAENYKTPEEEIKEGLKNGDTFPADELQDPQVLRC